MKVYSYKMAKKKRKKEETATNFVGELVAAVLGEAKWLCFWEGHLASVRL
jgi:hypothetical protein